MVRFTALQDFYSEETKSQYAKDLGYTARPQDELLLSLIPKWAADGKVKVGGQSAEVAGEG